MLDELQLSDSEVLPLRNETFLRLKHRGNAVNTGGFRGQVWKLKVGEASNSMGIRITMGFSARFEALPHCHQEVSISGT